MNTPKIEFQKADLRIAWDYVKMCMDYGMVINVGSIARQDPALAADLLIIKVMEFSKHDPDGIM